MSCGICNELYNNTTRKLVQCYCSFECCKKCFKSFILTKNEPCCMSPTCGKIYDILFLNKNLDKKFLNNIYKNHQENVLFNKIAVKLQAIQTELDNEKQRDKIRIKVKEVNFKISTMDFYISEFNIIIKQLQNYTYKCPIVNESKVCNAKLNVKKVKEYIIRCNKCDKDLFKYYFDSFNIEKIIEDSEVIRSVVSIHELQDTDFKRYLLDVKEKPFLDLAKLLVNLIYKQNFTYIKQLLTETTLVLYKQISNIVTKSRFLQTCNNNCNGFLDINLKCQSCSFIACADCMQIKDNNHKCDQNIIKSVALIKKEFNPKSCPVCCIPISKIEGCDHMWCIKCNTYFDWKTLKIMSGNNIQNPEFFDDMRRRNILSRNVNDVLCGRELDLRFAEDFAKNYSNIHKCPYYGHKKKCNLCAKHYAIYNMIKYAPYMKSSIYIKFNDNSSAEKDIILCKKFLLNYIDKKTFVNTLYKIASKNETNKILLGLFNSHFNSLVEILYRLNNLYKISNKSTENLINSINEYICEIIELNKITNIELAKVSNSYKIQLIPHN